jgi:hypothetical protein
MKAVRKIAVKDFELQRVQDNIVSSLNVIAALPLSDGVLLEGVDVATQETVINHGLGREARGYIVVRKSAAVDIYDAALSRFSVNLVASAPVTISLWIF